MDPPVRLSGGAGRVDRAGACAWFVRKPSPPGRRAAALDTPRSATRWRPVFYVGLTTRRTTRTRSGRWVCAARAGSRARRRWRWRSTRGREVARGGGRRRRDERRGRSIGWRRRGALADWLGRGPGCGGGSRRRARRRALLAHALALGEPPAALGEGVSGKEFLSGAAWPESAPRGRGLLRVGLDAVSGGDSTSRGHVPPRIEHAQAQGQGLQMLCAPHPPTAS